MRYTSRHRHGHGATGALLQRGILALLLLCGYTLAQELQRYEGK